MSDPDVIMVRAGDGLRGIVSVPGDKSISHRAVMFGGLLARGDSRVRGWLRAGDTLATLGAVRDLGITIEEISPTELRIHGTKPNPPANPLDLVNAGTGIRLLAGIMVGQDFQSVLDGSNQLRRRPMARIIEPLRQMGAAISGPDDRAPLTIRPAQLTGQTFRLKVASAQVKSAILLAGLFADGPTQVVQPGPARDHTEVMLKAMGADLHTAGDTVTLTPGNSLQPFEMTVPGDFSSTAFPLVAACIVPGSAITVQHVNLNPTRTGLLDVLSAMGADLRVTPTGTEAGEPVGDVQVRAGALQGVTVSGETVVRMIDEFPALMIAALRAEGRTTVCDAQELRVKETDRIAVMSAELRKLGAMIHETDDGFIIDGPQTLTGAPVDGHDDHRIAMSLTLAGLTAEGETTIQDAACIADSYPGFMSALAGLGAALHAG